MKAYILILKVVKQYYLVLARPEMEDGVEGNPIAAKKSKEELFEVFRESQRSFNDKVSWTKAMKELNPYIVEMEEWNNAEILRPYILSETSTEIVGNSPILGQSIKFTGVEISDTILERPHYSIVEALTPEAFCRN